MKATGIIREIDTLGRICLPKELRRALGIEPKDPIEIYVEGKAIVLKKHVVGCSFCGHDHVALVEFYPEKHICKVCVDLVIEAQPKLVFA